jgi:hypothetical protein|tara:strand:- start:25 stop:855 length:831 start_codon:yes stop_codon:yes gene_type:complete
MYFSTGDGANASGEAYAAPVNKLYSIQPVSATALDLIFDNGRKTMNFDSVRLTITSNKHKSVIASINKVTSSNGTGLITVCDADNSLFINSNITDCTVYLGKSDTAFYTQNITGTSKGTVTVTSGSFDSLLLTAITTATVNLYLTSQVGTDITSTTVVAAEEEAASASSVTLTVKTYAATADAFLNEKVYKSDGTLFGTCTAVNSTTEIVFGGGISSTISGDDVLYTGTRYYILKSVEIELGSTLKLEPDELNFDDNNYTLYITLASGSVDIITRQ